MIATDFQAEPVPIAGAPGSPYTRKMLAVLRYRRIPYRFLTLDQLTGEGLPMPRVPLLPMVWFADANGQPMVMTDSSPLIRHFEERVVGRAVVPADPALALIDQLFEDYADEWLTKPMFHFRWTHPDDIERSTAVLPHWRGLSRPDEEIDQAGRLFAERQIARLHYVGSNADTAAVIEQAYGRFVDALNAHLREHPYLMGHRPGASDFAIYGQLTQLAQFDPTPMAITLQRAPRVFAWVSLVEDLSGLEPGERDWIDINEPPATWRDLLHEIGRTYVPLMLANAKALAEGATQVNAIVDGHRWIQQPFPYQAKCLRWLEQAYAALDEPSRTRVNRALAGSGCEALFADTGQM